MKKVMVFGAFDILHPGHIDFLKQARKQGDYLMAIVARDVSVKKIKGQFPIENEGLRLKKVSEYVNKAVLGDLVDFYRPIKENNPDIICLGYDQDSLDLNENIEGVEIIRLKPHSPDKFKSSLLRNK